MENASIAAPLAQALAAKGYEALTPVQSAILEEGVAGRDLLVSAQTGSGKTVAFGLAIAPETLQGANELLFADYPSALIIAPTRELALQVAREFEWLYGAAQAKVATCVGGMDYRTEKRALDRGAHVVVGTPGRLRDHIERGSLKLERIAAVVLDEADEMLDMGFEEDLKLILSSCPEERRTLMFSATVPKEIEALARTYQKDALRIAVKSERSQHADIAYIGFSVQNRDRENAIFNLLRFHEARTSIVFCKTRANVNHLFGRMTERGFQAVALSGELSQTERTHALQALRDGRARVCIATDVAARGIDLPGLELVIHADLPGSSETLLHRSGRTGRAGQKGISALVVTPAEYKKAQRLLQGAKVVAEWEKAPSADEVQARDDERMLDHDALKADVGEEADFAAKLLENFGPDRVAAAFIRLWRAGRSAPEVLSDSLPPPAALPPRERGEFGPSVWFELNAGHEQRAEARWLLPKICDAGGIAKDGIGAIRVQTARTFVQIAEAVAGRFAAKTELDRDLTMTRVEGEPDLEARPAPRATARAPRPERAVYGERTAHGERAARTYTPRETTEERPAYTPREDRPAKTYEPRADKPAYKPKPSRIVEEGEGGTWTPHDTPTLNDAAPRKAYEKKPYEKKTYTPRTEGEYKPRSEGYKPRSDSAPRSEGYKPRTEGYKPRSEGAPRSEGYKPRSANSEGYKARTEGYKPKSEGFRSHGGPAGESRATGFKSHGSKDGEARTPYRPREEGDKPRSAGFKSGPKTEGFKPRTEGYKPAGKTYAAKPRADASDTSKRFVPPKRKP
ncbi:DEAD/DEAH box helicase [Stagnihabitans tardus]|uniref:DEAD/DEAH box helicase n=1 Tax=Stagnihabitans tardus TaxID=2699202 RepID=A0AAE4Y7G9_9RHOB|nr:DEAD/DEAH box helicase [Stagnihabitans tardus]NBZ86597.1 DEAD/DEAH box helicase [Stagnihabitans tardus]